MLGRMRAIPELRSETLTVVDGRGAMRRTQRGVIPGPMCGGVQLCEPRCIGVCGPLRRRVELFVRRQREPLIELYTAC